ncbi:MAG: NADH:flavin oxidoreductase/NADH oxidase [Sphingobacterium sp.]
MSKLFSKLELNNITLNNRIVVSPMCQYSAEDGFATDWHLVHLGQFAIGRSAAVMQEATAVQAIGRISYWDLGIWKDEHIYKFQQITSFIKSQGSIPGIQLAHAGRKASDNRPWEGRGQFPADHANGWQTVAPSPIPFLDNQQHPLALTVREIETLVEDFKKAAERAVQAGYQIVEIHAAHGYLIHQFLSPLVNQRDDEYGGSFANRTRLLLEIVDAIKPVASNISLWVRISATDWAEHGWDLKQSIALAKILKEKGVEMIDVSTGGAVHHQKIPLSQGYQVPFSQEIKAQSRLKTTAVGIITSAKQAEAILQSEKSDLVLIGRAFLDDPHLTYHFADQLNDSLDWAPQYGRAKGTINNAKETEN